MELQSQEIKELVKAYIALQAELGPVTKDGKNPHFKSKYATLEALIEALRGPLGRHGLSITQQAYWGAGEFFVVTQLDHTSGQWKRSYYPLVHDSNPQKTGSSFSYARRFGLKGILNISEEDDDGNLASHKGDTGEVAHDTEEARKQYKKELAKIYPKETDHSGPITDKQKKLLWVKSQEAGASETDVIELARNYDESVKKISDIQWSYFDQILKDLERGGA